MLGKLWAIITRSPHADVAELVDALASGAGVRKYVKVQVLSSAPKFDNYFTMRKSPWKGWFINIQGIATSSRERAACRY